MNITDLLLERIVEDEAAARAALALRGSGTDWPKSHPLDPARVLAECTAKRVIVNARRGQRYRIPCNPQADPSIEYWNSDSPLVEVRKNRHLLEEISHEEYLERVGATLEPPALELRALAAVYKDHPDYDAAWEVAGVSE